MLPCQVPLLTQANTVLAGNNASGSLMSSNQARHVVEATMNQNGYGVGGQRRYSKKPTDEDYILKWLLVPQLRIRASLLAGLRHNSRFRLSLSYARDVLAMPITPNMSQNA